MPLALEKISNAGTAEKPAASTAPVAVKAPPWAGPGIGPNNFDFLRFFFAVAVILSHSYALLWGGKYEPFMRITGGQVNLGQLAVDSFFIISGFLVTHSWLRSTSTLSYFKKRALRIYPAFVVAVLLTALIVFPLASTSGFHVYSQIKPVSLATHVARLQGYELPGLFPNNRSHAVNGSLWSISYEFWCYVGIALIGLCGILKRPWAVVTIFCVAIAISVVFLAWKLTPGGKFLGVIFGYPPFWARLLPYYLAGTLFYLYRNAIRYSGWMAALAVAAIAIGSVVPFGLSLALPVAWTYLLFWFAFHPAIRLHRWARFGDFSYGIYLFAFPIQQLLIMWWRPTPLPSTLFVVAALATLLVAPLSWHVVEKPSLILKSSRVRSPASRTRAAGTFKNRIRPRAA